MLKEYKARRNFKNTPEPSARKRAMGDHFRFVVQRHDATRLHYDFRLELGGVLKSWAVPKGPSMNPNDKRLAVHVEDHPSDYITFHGTIPEGNYGAGEVEIWDKGNFIPVNANIEPISERQALQALKKGELKFVIQGNILAGEFVIVRLKDDDKNWLLIKHKDEYAVKTIFNPEKFRKEKPAKTTKSKAGKAAPKAAGKSPRKTATKTVRKTATGTTARSAPKKKAATRNYAGKKS